MTGPELREQWFVVAAFRRDALEWVFRQPYPERYIVLQTLRELDDLHHCTLIVLGDAFFTRHVQLILPRGRGIALALS